MNTRASVARPDAIRRHNLGLLLEQVHRHGALTRAQLTQQLDLSRSTIGALVADLADLGLIRENVPTGGARAGRPSHVVEPRPDGPYAIAVDVDITHVTTAAVGIGGHVLARHVVETDPTPAPPKVVVRSVLDALPVLQDLVGGGRPVALGVSLPGAVNRHDGSIEYAPNLQWRREPFGALLAEAAPDGLSVSIGNDANLAVLAEHIRGSARGCDEVIYLIGRMGVGSGIITNGVPLRGMDGRAGEVGHNVVDASGPACHCGKRGCVETYIGEKALLLLAGRSDPPTGEAVRAVFADAAHGDEQAAQAVRQVADALGRTVASLVNIFDPQRVVLGGTLATVLELARPEVERSLATYSVQASGTPVELRPAALGDDGALLGAAESAFGPLLADPLLFRDPDAGRGALRR